MNITSTEYFQEIITIAKSVVVDAMDQHDNDRDEAEEFINDTLLHEVIDGHQWIIYNAYSLDVISHSPNDEYMVDCMGTESLADALNNGGLTGLHTAIAFWAMSGDVQDIISNELDIAVDALKDGE